MGLRYGVFVESSLPIMITHINVQTQHYKYDHNNISSLVHSEN